MMTIEQCRERSAQLQAIMDSPTASYWLKNAVIALEKRDPLDAARDAALLSKLFKFA